MNINVEFHRPDGLPDPMPMFNKLLSTLHAKIGQEQLEASLEHTCLNWGLNSGYYFKKVDDRFIFTHVALDPDSFNQQLNTEKA